MSQYECRVCKWRFFQLPEPEAQRRIRLHSHIAREHGYIAGIRSFRIFDWFLHLLD